MDGRDVDPEPCRDNASTRTVEIRYRRLSDHEMTIPGTHDQRGAIEVAPGPSARSRRNRLEQPAADPHDVRAGTERYPVQVDRPFTLSHPEPRAVATVSDGCWMRSRLVGYEVVRSDAGIGDEVADGHPEHDDESDQCCDRGVQRQRAHHGPTPCVEEQSAKRLTFEQGGHLTGQLGVGWRSTGQLAHLRIRLTAGHRLQVRRDELVGVGLGLRAGVDLLTRVLLQPRELGGGQRRRALGREGNVLGTQLGMHHVEPEARTVEQERRADSENQTQNDFDDPAGRDKANIVRGRRVFGDAPPEPPGAELAPTGVGAMSVAAFIAYSS